MFFTGLLVYHKFQFVQSNIVEKIILNNKIQYFINEIILSYLNLVQNLESNKPKGLDPKIKVKVIKTGALRGYGCLINIDNEQA
ncbi:hypothetical protein RCL_jg2589.t1 [Rhizophagus clarus]|uniref:Uncharacterized protein n=1 Tax=Rhizophagus clarus TaxID=94130 RepID=A0A8H3LJ85_9GLOM|nr:hypothetical protein RCL_jg2589.t1 [Rhizophagus clarus]